MTMDDRIHDEPSQISAEAGQVLIDGPGGIAITVTPDAATKMSDRLQRATIEAKLQRASTVAGIPPRARTNGQP
jgi:hypothetical protein